MVDDTQLGSYVGGHRAKRFYNMFSSSFESMLRDKTTKSTNFGSMEQVFSELQHLSAKEARCHRYFLEKSRIEGPVGVVALNEAESEYSVEDFGLDTMVSVARGVADELAEQSQHVSLVAFFDPPEESDLIQFRARRSRSFQEIDLRDLLAVLKIDNGGGHAGAVGFRVSRDGVHDFTGLIERIIRTVRDLVDRSKAV
jgi:nanoRNase/pAp phosphatase (c-di-AMP/oligoRNAs hydrolase)